MIKALFEISAEAMHIRISGHANSSPHGHDLVCAGVSSVAIGALNALKRPTDFRITNEEGLLEMTSNIEPSDHDKTVLYTMKRQLETIAEAHPKSIKITTKGSHHHDDV
ncbi:MAG TPA: ribosomal-processing cysteine protease Prp [Bacilli bacterium]|nr:ribosomal-processing cysteine protease Prp [Bacilli bacterium]